MVELNEVEGPCISRRKTEAR